MSTDREVARIVRSWLDEGVTALPDRVLDAVLDQVPATPQRRTVWSARRYADVNNMLKVALSAAAVVVVAVIGINLLPGSGGPGGSQTPVPSVTPAPSASASTVAAPSSTPVGQLPEGPLPFWEGPPAMTVTIAAPGWFGEAGAGILTKDENPDPPAGAGLIVFTGDLYVYGDPCKWSGTELDSPATTADELVTALAAQASRQASEPVDITLDGYAGKAITLHVPEDAVFGDCDQGTFGSWTISTPDGAHGLDPYRYHQGPGQIDEIWALDVDGVLTVIDWSHYAGTPAEDLAELEAIVRSMTFR